MTSFHSFLKSLLASHGPNYLEKLFGPKVSIAWLHQRGRSSGVIWSIFSLLIATILRWIFDYKWPDPLCLFSKFQVWTSGSEQPARSWRRWQSGDRSLRLKYSESTFDKKSPLSFCENAPIVVYGGSTGGSKGFYLRDKGINLLACQYRQI